MEAARPRRPASPPATRRVAGAAATWALRGLSAAVFVVVLGFFFLTRTDRGVGIVMGHVLPRLAINGEIEVGTARSERLLEGVRFYDLLIRGSDGRVFLRADSARLRYDWRSLLSGDVALDGLELWQPLVTVNRLPGESELNVQRLFSPGVGEAGTASAAAAGVTFLDVALHGGEIRVLYPARGSLDGRWPTVPAPGGEGRLVTHTFVDVEAHFPSVVLRSPDSPGQRVEIDNLALVAKALEGAPRIRALRGELRRREGRIDFDLTRLASDSSEFAGSAFVEIRPDGAPARYGFDVEAARIDLADLRWGDPRVPAGSAAGGVAMEWESGRREVSFRSLEVALEGSRIGLDGVVAVADDRFTFDGLTARVSPLALDLVESWIGRPLPAGGTLEGSARLDGAQRELAAQGRLTLQAGPDRGRITADFGGVVHLEGDLADGLGFTDLNATLDPLDFDVLGELVGGSAVGGAGRMSVQATGHTSSTLRFTTDLRHRPPGLPASDMIAHGSVSRRDGAWLLDLQADVAPLSLTALNRYYPDFPFTGEVTGVLRADGPLTDLTLTTDLTTAGGRLAVAARFDATEPGARYAVRGEVAEFELSELARGLPRPTRITGLVALEGSGTDPGSMTVDARARLRPSRVGGLLVDTLALALRARSGVLHVDTLESVAGGVAVQARGMLAMEENGPERAVQIAFQSDSLGRLRPLWLGDEVIVRDTLTVLDRELLLAQGVDPDTLPMRADVEAAGSVLGELTLHGSVTDFAVRGRAAFDRLRYGPNAVGSATVTFDGTGLPSPGGRLAAHVQIDTLSVFDRDFVGAELGLEYERPGGRIDFALRRDGIEDYTGRAVFDVTSTERRVALEQLVLRFGERRWALEAPSALAWNDAGMSVADLVIASSADSVRIEVDGQVPRQGDVDLRVDVSGLSLARLASMAQRDDLGLGGRVGLTARVGGTRSAPLLAGSIEIADLSFNTLTLSRLAGEVAYADRTLQLHVAAWQDSLRALTASGQVPVDLALQALARRVPTDRQMNLAVVADSLPAAWPLAYVSILEEVAGSVSGVFQIGGTVDDPSPSGTLTLNHAGWTFPALGVRHAGIGGTFTLRQDGTVDVDVSGRAGGTITTTGRVLLVPLTDPTFDLVVTAQNFTAVQRADVEGSVSGAVTLTGTYSRPVVRNRDALPLRVDEGILYVEEFQRARGVVDLTDPAFFSVVDTSVVNPRPLLGFGANPFLRNLRVTVDLLAARNTWLRSEQMNVEMGGALQIVYDRQSRELVMLGSLQAIRGTYSMLGRNFQVEGGSVEFSGTPGINPVVNIVANTRVRPAGAASGGDPIDIQAVMSGMLQDPRLGLASAGNAIAESDLVSYLVFGVPSYQLASGQAQLLEGAVGSILGTTFGAGLSILQGTLASRLSSLAAREWGLDYFAISQPEQLGLSRLNLSATLGSTTFEVGWYLEEDVFLTLLLRPLGSVSGSERIDPFGGARLDWVLADTWTLQAFFEDRWLRQPTLGFDQQILNQRKVAGVFLLRDWGYGRSRPPEPGSQSGQAGRIGTAGSIRRPKSRALPGASARHP